MTESGKSLHTGGIKLTEEVHRHDFEPKMLLILDRVRDAMQERPDGTIRLELTVFPEPEVPAGPSE